LASAFGGMGGEAFGVGSGGINRFTAILAGIFIGSAILLASIHPAQAPADVAPVEMPGEAGDTGGADEAGGGGAEETPVDVDTQKPDEGR
jgi:preprotein translocase subunit SecG